MPAKPPLKIVLCSPRGFCAGVVRAIDTVERALTIYGAPVYVRHEIVHNRYVVDSPADQGARFLSRNWPKSPTIPMPRWCSRPTGFPNRSRPTPAPAISSRSTPPVRWSPRCIARRRSISKRGPRNPADRAFPSSGGGRHARAIAPGRGDADRDRAGCRDLHAEGSQQSRLRHPDHAVDRRHRRNRRDAEGSGSPTSPARTRKTSATPPPTASSR